MSDKERIFTNAQIKYNILNIIKELTSLKSENMVDRNNLTL